MWVAHFWGKDAGSPIFHFLKKPGVLSLPGVTSLPVMTLLPGHQFCPWHRAILSLAGPLTGLVAGRDQPPVITQPLRKWVDHTQNYRGG